MPVSNDRISSLRSSTRATKRQRTNGSIHSRSPSPSENRGGGLYLPTEPLSPNSGRMFTRSMKHTPQGQDQQPSPAHGYPGPGFPFQQHPQQFLGPLFPMGDMVNPQGHPRFEPQYDPALYQQQYPPIRQTGPNVSDSRTSTERDGQHQQRERGGGEMFAAFLEADEKSRQMAAAAAAVVAAAEAVASNHQRASGPQEGLDWPSATGGSPNGPSHQPPVNPPGASGGAASGTGSWFDLFANAAPDMPNHPPPPSSAQAASDAAALGGPISWGQEGGPSGHDLSRILVDQKLPDGPATSNADATQPVPSAEHPKASGDQPDDTENDAEGEDDVDGEGGGDVQMGSSGAGGSSSGQDLAEGQDIKTEDGEPGSKGKAKNGKSRSKKAVSVAQGKAKTEAD
ncbi:hypothetical protein CPB83DRAFT_61773 [Crepidotus variabilis]|uniref:Uncharacterized protein n=1 Tax=Crepidotus variabilis TaxID=179855 RepID=A0A9P6E5V1_9AGAR|nr:hypothetical protein CPB83DRAFT_61773 [Crepidotus variabilis]